MKCTVRWLAPLAGLGLVFGFLAWTAWTFTLRYQSTIYDAADAVPQRSVALVFGAGYWSDGTPSDIMKDRVQAAVDLYQAGQVQKVLFSGDNRFVDYNEPEKMQELAEALGLPPEAIVLDHAGRRTYDTCYRARAIFGLQDAVLITQRYHLPRALYTCQGLGLNVVGYAADRRSYVNIRYYSAREIPALWLSWWDLWFRRPIPVLGDPIPIDHAATSASQGSA